MRLLIIFVSLFYITNSVFAFQDECNSEVSIVNTFQKMYNDESNKVMSKVKELDPAIELLDKQIQEIRAQVDNELVGATSSRIEMEKISRTNELTQKKLVLLRQQDSFMKGLDSYKNLVNNALKDLYVCRYNVMNSIIEELHNQGLTSEAKIEILNRALYYTDNEKQKNLMLGYIDNFKVDISLKTNTSIKVETPVIVTTSKNKKLSLKEKNALRIKKLKEKRNNQTQKINNF